FRRDEQSPSGPTRTRTAHSGQVGTPHRQAIQNLTFTEAPPREEPPRDTGDFAGDCARYSRFWESSAARLARLPAKPARNADEAQVAERIKQAARDARARFLSAHVEGVYDRLTQKP